MFLVGTTLEKFGNATITGHFDLCLSKLTLARKPYDNRIVMVFKNLGFQNRFRPPENGKPAFSNSSGLKSVFEMLRFRDGLTGEITLRSKIPSA